VMAQQQHVRIALVGAGRIGSIRAELIAQNPHTVLSYVVDSNTQVATQIANLYHSKVASELEEALPHVDAVWISVPTDLHPKLIKQAAAAKKAVATEKPVAFTSEEIRECFDACSANNVPLFVAFNRRCDPHFVKFKEALDKNRPAHIIRIVNRDHPLPLKEQFAHLGSIWADFLIHDFDMSLWLVGEAPSRIYAVGAQMLAEVQGTDVLDTALVNITFPSGTQISIEASRYSPGGLDQRLEAITRTATILANNPLRTEVTVVNTEHSAQDVFNYSFPQRYRIAYGNEIDHFAKMILNGVAAKVTREDCLLVAKMVDLADRSSREKIAISF